MKNEIQKLEQLAKYQAEIQKATMELSKIQQDCMKKSADAGTPQEFESSYCFGMATGMANGIAVRIQHFNNLITSLFKS